MAQNTASPDTREVPLDVFGGLVTYIDPTSVPLGVSPDCADVDFSPGGVSSRSGFKKVFATPMGTATVTYAKSYVDPKKVIRNLYLDSAGNLWVENLSASPGTYTLLTATSPGSYAKSVTAFGREYIAISDGLHGSDIALQYDGTNLDRVTQDGPGSTPTVSSVALPSVAMAVTGAPLVLNLAESDPAGGDGTFYTAINMYTADSVAVVNEGDQITIAGYAGASAPMNGTWTVTGIFTGSPNNLIILSAYLPSTTVFSIAAATGTVGGGTTMRRAGNIVTVKTTSAHQLQVGYQAQIASVTAATIGTAISKIVINNADLPGLATVTTSADHGLIPGLRVSLVEVTAINIGTAITSIVRAGQVVTVTTSTAHGLSPGASITTSSVVTSSFNTTAVVSAVNSTTVFTFVQVDVDASDSTGSVSLNWPIPDTATPAIFEVVAAPTARTFQVQINYSDSPSTGWTTGKVKYAWTGTFFVSSIIDSTTFTYLQYGPDATSNSVGTVTPYGQASPGEHQLQVFFITRQGYTTRPSPPVKFVASGGQYISVTNIPIGPSNVVARAIAFTGAQGAYFFYIPTVPQVNGQAVGTSTVIDDNTSTSAVLDFSDNTLFAALGISIQGNNLANQVILDGALGFGKYASRLITYGQRNTIQNLLNLGFDGGYLPNASTIPTGWDASLNAGGALTSGHYGSGWLITTTAGAGNKGTLFQSFYADYTGTPIATANAHYTIRVWLRPSVATANLTFTAAITSATTGFSSTAAISGSSMSTAGGFVEAAFSTVMPAAIPSDMVLKIYASAVTTSPTVLVDEISIVYTDTPYKNTLLGSYVNNPEGFDGVSGLFGPSDDTHPVLAMGIIRSNLYLLTQDPSGRLHQTSQGNTEPSGWTIDEVADNCGTVSAFSLTTSQADDGTAAGGEEWFAWYSTSGARVFGGEFPFKISQEIQRKKGVTYPSAPDDLSNINPAAITTVWALNDPYEKQMFFGIPSGEATSPNKIFMLSYLGCESAGEIAAADPVKRNGNGHMATAELSRKWSPWGRAMNGAALMFRESGELTPVFFNGNGLAPGSGTGYGNVYTLDPSTLTDDNYGQISPRYTTAGLPGDDMSMALQLGGGMQMLAYSQGLISGVGTMTIGLRQNTLANTWPLTGTYVMVASPNFNTEFPGGQISAQRVFFVFSSAPTSGTDNEFNLSAWIAAFKKNARAPVRGAYR